MLNSTPTIQAIAKKSITKNLLGKTINTPDSDSHDDTSRRHEDKALPEISITITIDRDLCYVLLNTS
jgi:hypothetical protein